MAVTSLGKWLYGATFVLLLPIALITWAMATSSIVHIPPVVSPTLGVTTASAGALLLILGMLHLWVHGGGLPMNAYPPPRYVAQGIFRVLPHPIYVGFSMICAGVSIAVGSASGLWLATPIMALSCAALVLGYERHDLRERFSGVSRNLLPPADSAFPSSSERLTCYAFVLLPWVVLYEAVVAMGPPPGAVSAWLPFERALPVLEWSEIFYASAYVFTALAPVLARTREDLRTFSVRALWAMALAFPLLLAVPLTAPPRPFTPHTVLGGWLAWERLLEGATPAFPSFRVIWVLLAAGVYARRWPRAAWVSRASALLICASCVTTGQNALMNVLAGFAIVGLVSHGAAVWQAIRSRAEAVANSWQEWRIGPVRIINHGIYPGLGATVALLIAGSLAGSGHETAVLVAAFTAVVGAALWAQYVEGSAQLLRPFGFYGGLLGGSLGALMAPMFGTRGWLVLAAFSAAGPWAQALGRLRCLVQGCCHGRLAPDSVGIRYLHPRSRVCRLTPWAGLPLHPTPVYSILWNVFVALMVTRLWVVRAPLQIISGMYFILTGLGRFVEEAWRGEPQTPIFAGLRLYQWAAVASVVSGALMTALGDAGPAPTPHFGWGVLLASVGFGVFVWFAMGVDFPESSWRFSRLT